MSKPYDPHEYVPRNVTTKCVDCGRTVVTGQDEVDEAPKCVLCRENDDDGHDDASLPDG